MLTLLILSIVIFGALAVVRRDWSNRASWIVVGLTMLGIFILPDLASRITLVAMALVGPLLAYPLMILFGLTILPLKTYFTFKIDAHRSAFPLHDGEELYKAAGDQVDKYLPALLSSGFVNRGRVGFRVKKLALVNTLLDRDNGRTWLSFSSAEPRTAQKLVMHCAVNFADGHSLIVTNHRWVDPNPPTPGFETIRMPSVGDPNELAEVAQFLAARSAHGPTVALPLDTDITTMVRRRFKKRQDAEAEAGWCRYDAAEDMYRPSFLGSFRMFWVSLPPWNVIIDRRDRARERAILAEMGLTPKPWSDDAPGDVATAKPPTGKERLWTLAAAAAVIAFIALIPEILAAFDDDRGTRLLPAVTVPGDFTVPDSFPDAVRALEQLVGQPSHQLSGTHDDNPAPTKGVAISMRMDSASAFVAAAQDAFMAKGFHLFRTGERYSGLDTDGLALWPSRDPYEIMRAMDTNAANYGQSVEDLIEWFKEDESRYPLRFTAIGFDYVGGKLLGELGDPYYFAARFIRFCPDIKSTGTVTVRSLGNDFKKTREFFCWWD